MTIKTKFNIGDKVFFLNDRKVLNSIVRKIKIEISDSDIESANGDITYICNSDPDVEVKIGIKIEERSAFRSKEELIKSL